MLQRTWIIMWKEFRQISRDPRMLGVVGVLPVMLLLLFGYAINLDVKHVPIAIWDQCKTQQSRNLIRAFYTGEYFDLVGSVTGYSEATWTLDGTRARFILVIPTDYSRRLAMGQSAKIQILVDGSDSTVASTALGYASLIVRQHTNNIMLEALNRAGSSIHIPEINNQTRYWYNPELSSTNFIVPGLIAVVLMMLSALLTSVTVVRERERGTIEMLVVSPVKPIELMIGKLTPYVIIAFADVLLVLLVSAFIFHIRLVGSPLLVLGLSTIFLVAALGLGLLISTVAKTQQIAMVLAVMATQLPTVLLSGFIFPISSMPKAMQIITNIVPATHFIKILREVFMKGSTLTDIWRPALLLMAIAFLALIASSARFKKKL